MPDVTREAKTDMLMGFGAVAMSLTGIGLLFGGWSRHSGVATLAGWVTLLSSTPLWMHVGGADRGIALGLLTVMLGAFALIATTADWRKRPKTQNRCEPARRAVAAPRNNAVAIIGFVCCAGPLSAAAAIAVALAIGTWIPMQEANRLVAIGMLTPLLWGAAAVASLYAARPYFAATVLGAIGALGLLHY